MALTRRLLSALALAPWGVSPKANAAGFTLQQAMVRARELREQAQRSGDQPYGAVVWRDDAIVGEAPSRVVLHNDPTAHAEIEALRDAAKRLGTRDLSGCVLVSTSRPCRMCEAAAGWARIERMVHGEALTDAGRPS